jgi:hypothetical protein
MKFTRKTCPSATLCNTNPTLTDPGSDSGFRGERPATNRLSHGRHCFSIQFLNSVLVFNFYLS